MFYEHAVRTHSCVYSIIAKRRRPRETRGRRIQTTASLTALSRRLSAFGTTPVARPPPPSSLVPLYFSVEHGNAHLRPLILTARNNDNNGEPRSCGDAGSCSPFDGHVVRRVLRGLSHSICLSPSRTAHVTVACIILAACIYEETHGVPRIPTMPGKTRRRFLPRLEFTAKANAATRTACHYDGEHYQSREESFLSLRRTSTFLLKIP